MTQLAPPPRPSSFHSLCLPDQRTAVREMSVETSGSPDGLLKEPESPTQPSVTSSLWEEALQEARSVSGWMAASTLIRISVTIMVQLIPYRVDCSKNICKSELPESIMTGLSIVSGYIVGGACPSKVAKEAAPGFFYASAWILMIMSDVFGCIPCLPLRIAESVLGRIGQRESILLLPLHFACVISTCLVLQHVLPESFHALGLEPIEYSHEDPWVLDFAREAVVTAIFCVAFLVLPELFRINKLPRWASVVLLYPIYNLSVDSSGKASSLAPNALLGLAVLTDTSDEQLVRQLVRLAGSLCGGLLGGLTMRRFFPDD